MKHKVKNSEDLNDIDSCTDDESEDAKGEKSHNDQDSDASFESDSDLEIDTAEIEEEDWIEYIKRRTSANWRVDCSRFFFFANLAFLTLISAVVKSWIPPGPRTLHHIIYWFEVVTFC